MLVLFETPAGYSIFKVTDEKKLSKTEPEDIYDTFFSDETKTNSLLELQSFQAFQDTADAVSAATATMEGMVSESLKTFLKKSKLKKLLKSSSLAVADKALAASLKETVASDLQIVHDSRTQELFRGIRCHLEQLMKDTVKAEDLRAMQLGLSHSLGRYKLKFSADKVDTMVIQAVGLLDELDKEINTYAMRVKEWYGWHFPELQGIVGDNASYAKLVLTCGLRPNFKDADLSSILEDESQVAAVKEAAEISMGTEIADVDVIHIASLAEQVLSMTEYRSQLFEYLKNRMNAIAPNLTILVGELVGARLISHAGSLMNLAKQPASTVQILGAEKALFRALKTKHDTPKYGLIYHASLIGQAAPKNKGKISRVLAAKAALAIRVDALSDEAVGDDNGPGGTDTTVGYEGRAKVEARLRQLEGGTSFKSPIPALTAKKVAKYDPVAATTATKADTYNDTSDMVLDSGKKSAKMEEDSSSEESAKAKKKKDKKEKIKDKNGKGKDKKGSDEENSSEDEKKAKKEKKKKEKEEKKSKKRKSLDGGDDDEEGKGKALKKAKKAKKEKRKTL